MFLPPAGLVSQALAMQGSGPGQPPLPTSTMGIPRLNQPPVQLPQLALSTIPTMLPNPQGYPGFGGGMPFIRNQTLSNVLGPLTQQNYGLPFVNPYGGGGMSPQLPIMGGSGTPSFLQFPGGQWGIQPIRGAVR